MTINLAVGFHEPVHQSQQAFRTALNALARPGRLSEVSPSGPTAPGLGQAATALMLTLADFETPVWLDESASLSSNYFRFHCGCPLTGQHQTAVIACLTKPETAPPLTEFSLGTDLAPELSTTLIIEVERLEQHGPLLLSGPGIRDVHRLAVDGLGTDWFDQRTALKPLFPRGLDMFLTAGNRLCGLPRTTTIKEAPCTSR